MNIQCDTGHPSLKWVREPSNLTRVVVIAFGVEHQYIELMHHRFSCFTNIAFVHVEGKAAERERTLQVQVSDDAHALLANPAFKQGAVTLGTVGKSVTYPIALGQWAERSVIDAVEQVKRFARGDASPQ